MAIIASRILLSGKVYLFLIIGTQTKPSLLQVRLESETNTQEESIMFEKVKGAIVRLIEKANQLAAKCRSNLGPALKAGKIIAAIYSVYAVTVLIGCGILGYPMRWLTEYPGADLVMEILAMISIITLILSGSIVEALQILLYGLECGAALASCPFGSLVGLAIAAVLFVVPLLIAVLVILCAPIIPILMHWYRKECASVS